MKQRGRDVDKLKVWTNLSLPHSKVTTERKEKRKGEKKEGAIKRERERQNEARNEGYGKAFLA